MPESRPLRLLVLQHQDDCPPGALAGWAAARGATLEIARAEQRELPDPDGHDGVVILGSDRSVGDDEPWITAELAWLRDATARVPVLGICFGAQALAVVLGGTVTREPPEIAWLELEVEPELDCSDGPWLCWHNDFIAPPPGATVLARSDRAVQAFASGPHLAVQFHPEVDAAIVEEWMRADELGRDLARAGVDRSALRATTARHAPAACHDAWAVFDAWLARARG